MRALPAPKEHFGWVTALTGFAPTSDARALEAVDDAGRIRGMVFYDSWTPNACQAHIAVETPIAWRCLLVPAFEYPFVFAGRKILLASISERNARSLRFAKSLGFREVHRVPKGWDDNSDIVLLEMRRNECPWLRAGHREAA